MQLVVYVLKFISYVLPDVDVLTACKIRRVVHMLFEGVLVRYVLFLVVKGTRGSWIFTQFFRKM